MWGSWGTTTILGHFACRAPLCSLSSRGDGRLRTAADMPASLIVMYRKISQLYQPSGQTLMLVVLQRRGRFIQRPPRSAGLHDTLGKNYVCTHVRTLGANGPRPFAVRTACPRSVHRIVGADRILPSRAHPEAAAGVELLILIDCGARDAVT